MPALATRVKRIFTKKTKTNLNDATPLSDLSRPDVDAPKPLSNLDRIVPLPAHITDAIPQEIYEFFVEYLRDDADSLRACSVVCPAWTRMCQRHLFHLLVRPYRLSGKSGFIFKEYVRCAAIHSATNVVYYGTARGVYSRNLADPNESPIKRLDLVDIRQLNIIDRTQAQGGFMLIMLSGRHLFTIPLIHVQTPLPSKRSSKPRARQWSDEQEFDYFSIGIISATITIAAVNSKEIYLLQPGPTHTLTLRHYITLNSLPTSVSLVRNILICVYRSAGFDTRIPTTWTREWLPKLTQFPPNANLSPGLSSLDPSSATALAVTSIIGKGNKRELVLCHDSYAVYMDATKTSHTPFQWNYLAKEIYFQDNYAFVISENHLEIRSLSLPKQPEAGQQPQHQQPIQLIQGKFRVLSGKSSTQVVLLREDGYVYGFRPKPET